MDLHLSPLRVCGLILCLALFVGGVSAASTDVHVVKLAADGKTVIAERTVDYRWLEANLPVRGDGSTHYYHQGPTFDDADLWDPTESRNVEDKDMGAVKGTALRDLCGLAGGMQTGDTLVVRASDGFSKRFSYGSVYSPSSRQGQIVLTWYKAGEGYVPSYSTGMRTVFLADTSTNPWGRHVFGNADMKATMPSSEWHYFNGVYPTTTGLSVQSVNELRILSTQSATVATTKTTTVAPTASKTTVAMTGTTTAAVTTGATAAPTTAQGATTAPPVSAAPTASTVSTTVTAVPSGTATAATATTAPADDGGSVVVITTTPPGATISPSPTLTTAATATPLPAANETNVTPSPTASPLPEATGYDRTYDYAISTGLDYVTDLETTETTTPTPTPTVTANATEATAATPVVTVSPSLAPSLSPTTPPGGHASTRSLSFTFSFQVRESSNGQEINASSGGSTAVVSPTSPLGSLWAFLKAVARLIDPFLT